MPNNGVFSNANEEEDEEVDEDGMALLFEADPSEGDNVIGISGGVLDERVEFMPIKGGVEDGRPEGMRGELVEARGPNGEKGGGGVGG